MKLRYITCSDPREQNRIEDIIRLAGMPRAEVAVQCHPSKMSPGMPRNAFWNSTVMLAKHLSPNISLAMHINQEWAYSICVKGEIPLTILRWMLLRRKDGQPVVKRIQLNMPFDAFRNINQFTLAHIIYEFKEHEFILQYNNNTKEAVEKLHKTGAEFSLLFDASGGRAIAPKYWQKPIYDEHPMGYSGGMSPDNVIQNLDQISAILPQDYEAYIDAEGNLKPDGEKYMDIAKAVRYVNFANAWQNREDYKQK